VPCASNVIQRPVHGSGLGSNLSARATTTRSTATLAQLTTPMPGALWRIPADGSMYPNGRIEPAERVFFVLAMQALGISACH
jgi:hypothetical protein